MSEKEYNSEQCSRIRPSRRDVLKGGAALGAVACLGVGGAAVAHASTPDGVLVVADQIDDIITLDPAICFEFSGTDVIQNVYDTLMVIDPRNPSAGVRPGVAESWSLSDDRKTYTFKIRKGLKFHSDNPVTASDVVFTLRRFVMLNGPPAPIIRQFGFTEDNVDELIKQTGEYEMTFEVDKPYASSMVLTCLSPWCTGIVDEKLAMANEVDGDFGRSWLNTRSAGGGAMSLHSWTPVESYILDRNDTYWREDIDLKRVVARHVPESATRRLMLERGDIDIAMRLPPEDIDAVRNTSGLKVEETESPVLYWIAMNQNHPILSKPEVRKAIKYAIDYDGITASITRGQAIVHQHPVPKGWLGASDVQPFSFNVEKAKELLAEAGHSDGFSVRLHVSTLSPMVDMAPSIQASLSQAGIHAELITTDYNTAITSFQNNETDLFLSLWGPDYPDPHGHLFAFAMNSDNDRDSGQNGVMALWANAISSEAVRTGLSDALMEQDADKRDAMYKDIQTTFAQESAFAFIAQQVAQSAMREEVNGYIPITTWSYRVYWMTSK